MLRKFFGEVKGIFNLVTLIDLGICAISILFGILFLAIFSIDNMLVTVLTALILIATGASSIISYLKKENIVLFNYNLFFGVGFIIIGIISFFFKYYISIILGIYLIIVALQKISYGMLFKKFNEPSWLLNLMMGVTILIIAIVMFFTSVDNSIIVTGIGLLGYGLINVVHNLLLRRRSSSFLA